MTTAVFIKRDKDIVGFKISGHSGFADKGFDIVCASISSASYLTINLLSQIDKNAKINIGDGKMSVMLSESNPEISRIMKAFEFQLLSISKEYPEFLCLCNLTGGKL